MPKSFIDAQASTMKFWCLTVTMALAVLNAKAYKNNFGKCARVTAQPNFDMQKMLGNWYVIEATSTSKRCLMYTLSKELGHLRHYLLTEMYAASKTAKFFGMHADNHRTGFLHAPSPENPAVMDYKMPSEILSYTFTVLDTDYDSYAATYVCKKMALGLRRWSAMILSRLPRLNTDVIEQIRDKFRKYNISLSSLSVIDHSHCKTNSEDMKKLNEDRQKSTFEEVINRIFKTNQTKPEPKTLDGNELGKETIQPRHEKLLKNDETKKNLTEEKPLFIAF